MGGHRAKRIQIECPVCHDELDGDLSDHLRAVHSKEELVKYVIADMAADEYNTFV